MDCSAIDNICLCKGEATPILAFVCVESARMYATSCWVLHRCDERHNPQRFVQSMSTYSTPESSWSRRKPVAGRVTLASNIRPSSLFDGSILDRWRTRSHRRAISRVKTCIEEDQSDCSSIPSVPIVQSLNDMRPVLVAKRTRDAVPVP